MKLLDLEINENNYSLVEDAKVALELVEQDCIFILLDTHQAYMREGHAFPLVDKGIYLFHNYDDAKNFVDQNGVERWDLAYPIGALEKKDKFTSLKNTLLIANALGVVNVFLDGSSFFKLDWFVNAISNGEEMTYDVRLTAEESNDVERMLNSRGGMPARFNPIFVYNYSNPFEISDERKDELSNEIFEPKGSTKQEVLDSLAKNTLHENCYCQMLLRAKFVPMAMQKNDQETLGYFNMMQNIYAEAIVKQLAAHNSLHVLYDKATHDVFVRQSPAGNNQRLMYLTYTDLFKYLGPCDYKQISGLDELRSIIAECSVAGVVVTDGPSTNALIDKEFICG